MSTGWSEDILQQAISQCNTTPDQISGVTEACPVLTVQNAAAVQVCKTAAVVSEPIEGVLQKVN